MSRNFIITRPIRANWSMIKIKWYNKGMGENGGVKRWTQIFRAFGNPNRVLIVKILARGKRMGVSGIAKKLDISIKTTSKHLIILSNLDVLNSLGRHNHVFYELNPRAPADIREAIKLFC